MKQQKVMLSANASWNITNFRAGLVRALIDQGHEVVVAAPEDSCTPLLAEMGCRHAPLTIDNKGTSPRRDLALYFQYLRLLRVERPDVFLGFTIKPNVYGSLAAYSMSIPVLNNVSGLGTAFIRENWITRIVRLLYRLALRSSDTVFFQNPNDRDLFVRVGPGETGPDRCCRPGRAWIWSAFGRAPADKPQRTGTRFLLIAQNAAGQGCGRVRRCRPGGQVPMSGYAVRSSRLSRTPRTAPPLRSQLSTSGSAKALSSISEPRRT